MSPKYLMLFILCCAFIIWTHPTNANAVVQSSIIITNPTVGGFVSVNTITYSGVITSPDANPGLLVDVDGNAIPTNLYNGNWNSPQSVSNGWHTLTARLTDSNGIKTASVQFLVSSGHMITTKYDVIAIEYSETCQRIIQNNIDGSCPTIGELKQYDTSNQAISGHFVLKKDGSWVRTKPQTANHYTFYTNDTNKVVCVDCQIDLSNPDIVQSIFIEPNGFSYVKHNFSTDVQSNSAINSTININSNDASLVIFYDRYVDDSCKTANMDYNSTLMIDTIGYLKSGCTITHFNKTSTSIIPVHKIDYSSSPQYQYEKWKQQSLKLNVGNCITNKCAVIKDPFANW